MSELTFESPDMASLLANWLRDDQEILKISGHKTSSNRILKYYEEHVTVDCLVNS
jgi:hypothetical protein